MEGGPAALPGEEAATLADSRGRLRRRLGRNLETAELDLARQRQLRAVKKFLAGLTRPAPKGRAVVVPSVTMAEVAVGVYEARQASGIKHWDNERRWWRKHARELHDLQPRNVTTALIETTLLAGKERGLSRRSLSAVLTEIDRILNAAKKQRLVTELVTTDVELPRVDRRKRKRVQLTDAEFVQYLMHPDTLDYSDTENARRKERGGAATHQPRDQNIGHRGPLHRWR